MSDFNNYEINMDEDPADDIDIEILYDDKFYQKISDRKLGTWIQMRIKVGDVYVVGDADGGYSGHTKTLVYSLMETVKPVLNNETAEVVFNFHPYYLGIHQRDSETVFVGGYHSAASIDDPTIKLDVDTRRPATKRAWIKAVIEISEEFHEVIVDTNPDLHGELDWFREKLDEVRDVANDHNMLD